jgi:hypothetical protein
MDIIISCLCNQFYAYKTCCCFADTHTPLYTSLLRIQQTCETEREHESETESITRLVSPLLQSNPKTQEKVKEFIHTQKGRVEG